MSNPYTSVSIVGYNASPPPDDGTQSEANKVEWAKHKEKLSDPVKTLAEGIDTNVLAAFASLVITDDPGEEGLIVGINQFSNANQLAELATAGFNGRLTAIEGNYAKLDESNTFTAIQTIKTGDAGTITIDTGADELLLEGSGDTGLSIHVPDANAGKLAFGSDTNDSVASIRAEYNSGSERIIVATDGTDRLTIQTGLVVGSPAGGDKGAGTINAELLLENGIGFRESENYIVASDVWSL